MFFATKMGDPFSEVAHFCVIQTVLRTTARIRPLDGFGSAHATGVHGHAMLAFQIAGGLVGPLDAHRVGEQGLATV